MNSFKKLLGTVSGCTAILLAGCGASGGSAGAAVPATVAPQAVSGQFYDWSSVSTVRICEGLNPAYCSGNFGFRVSPSGQYVVGYLRAAGQRSGTLTAAETQSLIGYVNDEEPFATGQCSPQRSVPGVTDALQIARINGSVICPTLRSDGTFGPAKANTLDAYMTTLLNKYYPRPF